ncbi:MucR family transcriptional regulator [Lichenihabitans psoromatis]|uniref:MucR family transcriptional regulator n=1 Tax=Lichenihabitans psoromatis TaxID=2528642 RepID=UPI001036B039|nr:MucR family transcriptional regulator [Lichenihabitans psoromatis]
MANLDRHQVLEWTADIVAAFVSNNAVHAGDVSDIITTVYASLTAIASPKQPKEPVQDLVPAVSIKKSVTNDYLICLEDGKSFKSLKRHLQSAYGLTPDQYRAKWGLPRDYPMVAPAYAAARSLLAKESGLGVPRNGETVAAALETIQAPANDAMSTENRDGRVEKRRGRPKKAA